MLGVNNQIVKSKSKSRRRDKKQIKVTYISSPMKVKTSASNFRTLVQELTGQDSNVAETFVPMEANVAESVLKGSTHQQWRVGVAEGYLSEATSLKPDYSEFHSRSSIEPLNEHLDQYDLLSFDMS